MARNRIRRRPVSFLRLSSVTGGARGLRSLLLPLACVILLAPAVARSAGRIEGKILDADTEKTLAFANVVIVGTQWGAMSQADGAYAIFPLAPGSYEVQASFLGYETARQSVVVTEGETAVATFRMKPTVAMRAKEVTIRAERPLVDVKRASTVRTFDSEELRSLALQPTLDNLVEQQPGVTKDNDQIHIRGGRADETLFIVDGVKTRDLLSGDSKGSTIGARSVAEVNIITGGFDAKYGQALSGIVEAKLKEGTDQPHGYLGYTTDHGIGDTDTDLYDLELSGPMRLVPRMKYFLSLSSDLSNGYLPSIANLPGNKKLDSSYRDSFAGQSFRYQNFFYPRANNDWRMIFKTSWRATKSDKFDLSYTKSLSFGEGFGEANIADINRNITNYPWTWAHRFDHYYTVSEDQNTFSLTWNRGITPELVHSLALTRFFTARHQDVAGKLWTQYDPVTDSNFYDPVTNPDPNPAFRNVGDAPQYQDRYVDTWSLSSDWTLSHGRHKLDWGASHQIEDVQYMTLDATTIKLPDKPLGDQFDLFHVYPASGAMYLQDRIEYESLIAGVGLRYDYWFPGLQVQRLYDNWQTLNRPTINAGTRQEFLDETHSIFGYRFKGHLSPRIQVSHPISDHDNLFFNYGHFSQRPAYYYVYAKSSSQSSEEYPEIGNPNLNPEISVQYEMGAGHQFKPDLAARVSLFYKDIYDYPTSTTLVLTERTTSRSNFFIYRNLDYARSTGFEMELRKRRLGHWSGMIAYTYSVAKGKSSDPNNLKLVQLSGGDARETDLGEMYMWWNRPHKFTAWYALAFDRGEKHRFLGIRVPDDWNLSVYTMLQSGRAYTPQDENGADTGQQYSRNGPMETTTDAKLRKGFHLLGLRLEGSFEVFNLFNNRTALTFDPSTGKAYVPGKGQLSSPYDNPANLNLSDADLVRVTGAKYGADQTLAQVAAGIRQSIWATIWSYANPSYRSAPRSMRLGVGIEW